MRTYSLLVPSGYVLVDLEGDITRAVDGLADRIVLGLDTSVRRRARGVVVKTLTDSFTALAKGEAFAALISSEPLAEQALRPLMVLSRFRPEAGGEPLEVIVAMAASQSGASMMETDSMVGLRVERTDDVSVTAADLDRRLSGDVVDLVDAQPGGRGRLDTLVAARRARRVRYFLGQPGDEHSWIEIGASVQVAGDAVGEAFADAFVGVFDLVAKTFKWEEGDE